MPTLTPSHAAQEQHSIIASCPPCGAKQTISDKATSRDHADHLSGKFAGEWSDLHAKCEPRDHTGGKLPASMRPHIAIHDSTGRAVSRQTKDSIEPVTVAK